MQHLTLDLICSQKHIKYNIHSLHFVNKAARHIKAWLSLKFLCFSAFSQQEQLMMLLLLTAAELMQHEKFTSLGAFESLGNLRHD